jgi:hypothetical protein
MDPAEEKSSTLSDKPVAVTVKNEPENTLFAWRSPARPFKRRDKQFYATIIIIASIVGFILFLTEGFMPVILLISLIFLYYILNTVQPEEIEYSITNKGIKVVDKKTEWNALGRFWFSRRFDSDLLILETAALPGRMEVVIKKEDKETIKKTLSPYLTEEEVPPSALDKAANWFAEKLPGAK